MRPSRLFGIAVLGLCIAATWYFQWNHRGTGVDFLETVWAPGRALLRGVDPFDPRNSAYRRAYRTARPAPLNTPISYLAALPSLAVGSSTAVKIMAILNPGLVWAAVLVLLRPRTPVALAAAGLAGVAVVMSYANQNAQELGQLSPAAMLGLGLVVTRLKAAHLDWAAVLGVVLVCFKPQFAAPMLVILVLLRAWRVLIAAVLILVVGSAPGLVLFLRSASGISSVPHIVRANLAYFNHLPVDDLSSAASTRIDLFGTVARLGGPILSGLAWALVSLVLMSAVVFVLGRHRPPATSLRDPVWLSAAGLCLVLSLYHQPYDGLILFAGPLVALAAVLEGRARPEVWVVLGGGAVLVIAELLARFPDGRIPGAGPLALTYGVAYTVPCVIAAATTAAAETVRRR